MGVYNFNWDSSLGVVSLYPIVFRENISSNVDPTLIDNGVAGSGKKTLLGLARGRKTNFIRAFSFQSTIDNATYQPTYTHNDRYWEFRVQLWYPTTTNISIADIGNNRVLGNFVAPVGETYDITMYYGERDLRLSTKTLIPNVNIVLNVTVDQAYQNLEANNPLSYYTQYTNNDQVPLLTAGFCNTRQNIQGLPASNAETATPCDNIVDINQDVQYGVQTWTPTYEL
jgi:hypothetical protein|tara:strand:+ start:2814 stop:3494 length:681 start_codon:yes stop_codon:yes gene_type:complete